VNAPQEDQEKTEVPLALLSSIEPVDVINSFVGSMVLLLLPINESGCEPTALTAEYTYCRTAIKINCIQKI
jgi:hypothetical protein